MPIYDIAANTQPVRMGQAVRQAKADRAATRLTDAQARIKETSADFYEQSGLSPAAETARSQNLKAQQERRLRLQQAYSRSTEMFNEQAQYANEIAAAHGELPKDIEEQFRNSALASMTPFASAAEQSRREAIAAGEDPNKYPSYGQVLGTYNNIAEMAIAEGEFQYRAEQAKANEEAEEEPIDALKNALGSPFLRDAKDSARSIQSQSRVVSDVVGLTEELSMAGEDPARVFGTQGGILRFAGDIKQAVDSVGTYVGDIVDEEGNVLASGPPVSDLAQQAISSDNPRTSAALQAVQVPESMEGTQQARRYRSSIIELAYAIARAREPSGRLSNQDFTIALETVGAESGDPRGMLAASLDHLGRGMEDVRERVNQAHTVGNEVGIEDNETINALVFGVRNMDELFNMTTNARERVNQLVNKTRSQMSDEEGWAADRVD